MNTKPVHIFSFEDQIKKEAMKAITQKPEEKDESNLQIMQGCFNGPQKDPNPFSPQNLKLESPSNEHDLLTPRKMDITTENAKLQDKEKKVEEKSNVVPEKHNSPVNKGIVKAQSGEEIINQLQPVVIHNTITMPRKSCANVSEKKPIACQTMLSSSTIHNNTPENVILAIEIEKMRNSSQFHFCCQTEAGDYHNGSCNCAII